MIPAALLVLAITAAAFVLGPLRRPEAAPADDPDAERLFRARDAAYRALRELEMDRAAGKVGEGDYVTLRRRFEAEAIAALHQLDARMGRAPHGATGEMEPGGDGSA